MRHSRHARVLCNYSEPFGALARWHALEGQERYCIKDREQKTGSEKYHTYHALLYEDEGRV